MEGKEGPTAQVREGLSLLSGLSTWALLRVRASDRGEAVFPSLLDRR